jgi:hypothetical protein
LDRREPGGGGAPDEGPVPLGEPGGEKSTGSRARATTLISMSENGELSDRDVGILDFERSWWKHAGAKEQAIKDRFDMSATRYYQILNELLEDPAAEAYDQILVKRLKRLRVYRQRQRVARLLGADYAPNRR